MRFTTGRRSRGYSTRDLGANLRSLGASPSPEACGRRCRYQVAWLAAPRPAVGEIIAAAGGMPFEKYVHQGVLTPLGMRGTGFVYPAGTFVLQRDGRASDETRETARRLVPRGQGAPVPPRDSHPTPDNSFDVPAVKVPTPAGAPRRRADGQAGDRYLNRAHGTTPRQGEGSIDTTRISSVPAQVASRRTAEDLRGQRRPRT